MADPWFEIERITGEPIPDWVKEAFLGPKLVHIPAGRTLYAAGPLGKTMMRWGGFEELDDDWYERGNQLDRDWYTSDSTGRIAIYEYSITTARPTPAIMGKVADQPGASKRIGPAKFQYYSPIGLGEPKRGRLLGNWHTSIK